MVSFNDRYSQGTRLADDLTSSKSGADAPRCESRFLMKWMLVSQHKVGHGKVPGEEPDPQGGRKNGFSTAALRDALDSFGVQFSSPTFYVLCPQTQTPVSQQGEDVLYERLSSIPERIECENHVGGARRHLTKGNTWIRVGQSVNTGCVLDRITGLDLTHSPVRFGLLSRC